MPKKAPNNYTIDTISSLGEDIVSMITQTTFLKMKHLLKGGDKKDRANRGDKETASGEVNVA